MIGPMLGGGHGVLQGHYGLLADNLISARVVLANGSIVTVSSSSHPDLFWAIRGAGHNFGIVTGFEYRIYDAPQPDSWVHIQIDYHQQQLETFLGVYNSLASSANHPPELTIFAYFMRDPLVDTDNVSSLSFRSDFILLCEIYYDLLSYQVCLQRC
jgi:FAD/FMN-containing dehydrogenase